MIAEKLAQVESNQMEPLLPHLIKTFMPNYLPEKNVLEYVFFLNMFFFSKKIFKSLNRPRRPSKVVPFDPPR